VRKLGGTGAEYNVPGPGTYTPQLVGKERASSWVMGDRNARKSAVDAAGESPGPVYQMRSSVTAQMLSDKASSPRFGFGTQRRLAGSTEHVTPGPGAYTPRLTNQAAPSNIQTVAAGQLTELTTPRHSSQIVAGTWSRVVNRSLATVRDGPSAVSYTPSVEFTTGRMPAFTMRELGSRAGIAAPGAANTPGPLAYHPSVKSRFGGGQFGDSPRYSLGKKDEDIPRFISNAHSRIYQGKHSPSPAAYTPLEEFGITSYTVSNTSTHAPIYAFGSEPRPCAP